MVEIDLCPIPVRAVFPAAAFGGNLVVVREPAPPALLIAAAGLAARVCGRLAEARPLALYRRVLLASVVEAPRQGDPLLPLPLIAQPDGWWGLYREAVRMSTLVSYGWERPGRAWERAVERAASRAWLSEPERGFLAAVLFAQGAGEQVAEKIIYALRTTLMEKVDDWSPLV